jgi:predicted HTH transcriptional regulator
MHDAMLNHGLNAPAFSEHDGFFVVTFPGPNGNYERLNVPEGAVGLVTPAVEAQLNDRQKKMVALLLSGEELTSRRCAVEFQVTRPVTARDFGVLVQLQLAEQVGAGRSTRYRLKSKPNR